MALCFELSADQRELQRRASERFVAIRARHQALPAHERPRAAFDEVWAALADLGFLGFLIPASYGGRAGGLLEAALVMEELAAVGLHSFGPILAAMGSIAVARSSSESLKHDLLPRIASGDLKLAIASTEAEAGFNVLNAKTFAERKDDGYRVNGSKIYVSGLDIADYAVLVTRTMTREECRRRGLARTAGLSLLLIDTSMEGVGWNPVPSRGEAVLTQFALELRNVRVPASRLIGREHQGTQVMFHMFNPERTLASSMALGMARYCLDRACKHARTRVVFGDTPIGAYQSVQHPLAEVAIRLDAARLVALRSALLFDDSQDPQVIAESANSAKYLSAELAVQAVDAAIDAFGGKGFDTDFGILHLWEAARLLRTSPISNALILNQIAQRTLELPRSY